MPSSAEAINRAFSKQSLGYDLSEKNNRIIRDMRRQVYAHVERYLKPQSRMLELNAGTGVDALYFSSRGHDVHATDLSDGMINQIRLKASEKKHAGRLTVEQLSFEHLDRLDGNNFDYVFSNFGGLNCCRDLSLVTQHLSTVLRPDAYITWVIMPPVCLAELLWCLKGNWTKAARRFTKNGSVAHVEGEHFRTYYHSLNDVRTAFGRSYNLIQSEGLAALSPQPHHSSFATTSPGIYSALRKVDKVFRNHWPFNRWADHIIVTFQYKPDA